MANQTSRGGARSGRLCWMMINPELSSEPIILGYVGGITILAVAVFLLPLFGAHRLMEVEKERLLYPLDHEFEVLFSRFNNGLHEDDYSEIERLNGVITNLEFQYHRIKNIPTWPWKPETAQLALTAIALPLALTIIRFLIERAFK